MNDRQPPAASITGAGRLRPAEAVIGIASLAVGIAAFLPWITAFVFSVSGIRGDGRVTLGGAVLGVLLLLARSDYRVFLPAEVILGCGAATVGFHDLVSIESSVPKDLQGVAGAGSGLYLTAIAGTVWAIAALYLAARALVRGTSPVVASKPAPSPAGASLDASPLARARRVPRGAVIGAVAFVLGGGVATVVILLRGGDSGQADTVAATTTQTTPQPPSGSGSGGVGTGPSHQGGETAPTGTFSTPPPIGPPDLGGLGFQSPTGNLQCVAQVDPEGPDWVEAPEPLPSPGIECTRLNDGLTVDLDATGPNLLPRKGETPGLPTLPYGSTWGTNSPTYWCVSFIEGIECEHVSSGRGFFLNRTAFKPLTR